MTLSDTRINQGGLMRCCIQSIVEHVDAHADEPAIDTDTECRYCHNVIELRDGVWRWGGRMNRE